MVSEGVREGGQGGQTVIGDGINVYMTNQNELPSVWFRANMTALKPFPAHVNSCNMITCNTV